MAHQNIKVCRLQAPLWSATIYWHITEPGRETVHAEDNVVHLALSVRNYIRIKYSHRIYARLCCCLLFLGVIYPTDLCDISLCVNSRATEPQRNFSIYLKIIFIGSGKTYCIYPWTRRGRVTHICSGELCNHCFKQCSTKPLIETTMRHCQLSFKNKLKLDGNHFV